MLDTIVRINQFLNGIVGGPIMLALLIGTGIYLTCGTKFFQVRKFASVMKNTIGGVFSRKADASTDQITPFQAVSTAIASTVGVGNIAGVATAIVSGGAGAIFWMWIAAFFGMMTKYSEVVLSIYYRETNEQGIHYGGPMYYIEKGLKLKWLAVLFSIFGAVACFGIGNMNQSNEIAAALYKSFGVPKLATGIAVAVIVSLVIIGGIKRIGKVTEKIVPFMAIFYLIGGVIALIINIDKIPDAFSQIITQAFSFEAVGGGIMGYVITRAMKFGFSRGVFSNEAGLGSAPIAHASSDTDSPVLQGMWGVFEVFVDTIVVCSITALVILTSGLAGTLTDASGALVSGGVLTSAAYEAVFGPMGGMFISITIVFFAISTIFGWSYYGERCIGYIFGNSKNALIAFRGLFICFIVVGALGQLTVIWDISDTLNSMMAIPNLIALIGLSGKVFQITKENYIMTDHLELRK